MAYERHLRDVLALHKPRNDLDVAATASTAGVVSANTGPFSRLRSAAGPAIRLQSEALPGGALGVELSGPHLHDLLAPEARQHRPPAPARRHAEQHRASLRRVRRARMASRRFPRFGGGAYHPILRRLEVFTDEPLRTAFKDHEKRATIVLDLEEKVAAAVKKLKERGLVSPYLRSFVVARINPLRWIKGEPPPLEEVLKTMRERAARFNVEKIKPQDLAGAAGPPDKETEET